MNRWLAVLALAVALPVQAGVYKCVEGGKTVFSDQPCGKSSEIVTVRPSRGAEPGETGELLKADAAIYQASIAALRPAEGTACSAAKEKGSLAKLDAALDRFNSAYEIARVTPRASLGAPMMQMAIIRDDIKSVTVTTPCLVNLRDNAALYADLAIESMKAFAIQNSMSTRTRGADAAKVLLQYNEGKRIFGL